MPPAMMAASNIRVLLRPLIEPPIPKRLQLGQTINADPACWREGLKTSFQPAWALTLFHYGNHGDDVGRVLAGVSVQPGEREALTDALIDLGYPYVDETENPASRLFLDGV